MKISGKQTNRLKEDQKIIYEATKFAEFRLRNNQGNFRAKMFR